MPYYYDHESGDLEFTSDANYALRSHVAVMAGATRYPLNEEAVGQLHRFLGPAPVDVSRRQALARLQQALSVLGLAHLSIDAAIEMLDDGWQMILRIENNDE